MLVVENKLRFRQLGLVHPHRGALRMFFSEMDAMRKFEDKNEVSAHQTTTVPTSNAALGGGANYSTVLHLGQLLQLS